MWDNNPTTFMTDRQKGYVRQRRTRVSFRHEGPTRTSVHRVRWLKSGPLTLATWGEGPNPINGGYTPGSRNKKKVSPTRTRVLNLRWMTSIISVFYCLWTQRVREMCRVSKTWKVLVFHLKIVHSVICKILNHVVNRLG